MQLAFILYHENDEERAEELLLEIRDDLNQKTAYFRELGRDQYMLHIFTADSAIVSSDLKQVQNGNWSHTPFLLPEDMRLNELKMARKEILELLKGTSSKDQKVKIHSTIEIEILG